MLTIRHIRHWYEPRLPHAVFLDGLYAGMLKDDQLPINAPQGRYLLKVQFGGRVPIGKNGKSIDVSVSSTKQIEVPKNGDVESKEYLMLRVQQGDVYSEARLYQPGDPTFKLGAIGTTLTGNYYISSDKVNITLSNGSEVQAYLRAHYNDECKMKLEYSSTATFEEATLLEDYVGFTSLYASLVRADNGLEILDHSKGTMSQPDLVTIRKKAKGSSYSTFEEIVLSQVL